MNAPTHAPAPSRETSKRIEEAYAAAYADQRERARRLDAHGHEPWIRSFTKRFGGEVK
jgi:hypothetical protein